MNESFRRALLSSCATFEVNKHGNLYIYIKLLDWRFIVFSISSQPSYFELVFHGEHHYDKDRLFFQLSSIPPTKDFQENLLDFKQESLAPPGAMEYFDELTKVADTIGPDKMTTLLSEYLSKE